MYSFTIISIVINDQILSHLYKGVEVKNFPNFYQCEIEGHFSIL